MAIDYNKYISAEQRAGILKERIQRFATEAWQHELNKKTCEAVGDEAGVASSDAALAALEAAIGVNEAELVALAIA